MDVFENGTPYVQAGVGKRMLAWLIDFIVYLVVTGAGAGAIFLVARQKDLDRKVLILAIAAVLLVVPLILGLFYTGGRALGALATGTRLVRLRDGGRIGAKGPWAMLVRTTLTPLVIVLELVPGLPVEREARRVTVDVAATARLYARYHHAPAHGHHPTAYRNA